MILAFLLSCREPADALNGQLLASDLRAGHWFTADLQTDLRVAEFPLASLEPDVCMAEETGQYCLLFQSRSRVAYDGAPEILFTYSPLDARDQSDRERGDLNGRYVGVDARTHERRWGFEYLDFSLLGENPWCPYDPADPCHPADDLSDTVYHNCRLRMPHDMVVTYEDDEHLEMWVADSNNFRLLGLTVPRDSDCAQVTEVVDVQHPDWDIYLSDNSMELWEEDGVLKLLMTVKGSTALTEAGQAQLAGEGKGKVMYWERSSAGWSQIWEFPPTSTSEESFVNTPHGVARVIREDGREWVLYAHSLGLSNHWNTGTGGSIGVLEIIDGQPVYLFDALIPGEGALHFPRDVVPLPDGSFLLVDSGCLGDDCEWPTQAWWVSLDGLAAGDGDGVWTVDHSRLERREATVLAGPLLTQADMLYSVEWLDIPLTSDK